MQLYAAVDLLGGRSVRLLRGSFSEVTDYGDALEAAAALAAGGAGWLHVVDLAAARSGVATERALMTRIVEAAGIPVQVGGGVRSASDVAELLDAGVSRVVMGTAALEDPSGFERICAAHPGAVAVGLDHLGSPTWRLALRGWEAEAPWSLAEAARHFEKVGAAALVVTSIPTDGTLAGPDYEGLGIALSSTSEVAVIASGGVGRRSDLEGLAAMGTGGRKLEGVIVGKALASGEIGIEEAVAACARRG